MSISGIGGYAVQNQPATKGGSDAKTAAPPAAPPAPVSSGPVDTVDLSPGAVAFTNFSGPVKLNLDGGIRGNAGLLAAAGIKPGGAAGPAEASAMRKEVTDYAGKLNALVSETFGLTVGTDGWGAGGAALSMIDALAERNGLAKPKSMAGDSAAGEEPVGTLDIALGAKDGVPGGSARILFDANAAPAANGPLIDLSGKGAEADGVLSMLKDSPLGKALEQSGWSPNGTKKAYAVTSGDGADAKVSALFVSDGKDGYVQDNASRLLGTIRSLMG